MKMHRIDSRLELLIACGILALFAGCATPPEKELKVKEAQESSVKSNSDLNKEADHLLETAPNLTVEQRQKLTTLSHQTRQDIDALRDESIRLRAVLIQDVLAPKYDEGEVSLIKSKMQKVEEKRLTVLFNAVAKASDILGRATSENGQVMKGFIYMATPPGRE